MEAKGMMRALVVLAVAVAIAEAFSGKLTLNGFDQGESGGGPSECDGQYHRDTELIVALSTPWYHQVGCFNMIKITASSNGRSVVAKVVDECDTSGGCESDIVDGSQAVWDALGLNTDDGEVPITWNTD